MTKNSVISEQTSNGKSVWTLPREKAIALLMTKHNIGRERAEAILRRDPNEVRRHAVNRLSEEEFNRLEEEAAASPSILTLSRKDIEKQFPDETEHGSD